MYGYVLFIKVKYMSPGAGNLALIKAKLEDKFF